MENKKQTTWEECINFSKEMWVALFYAILFLGFLIGFTSILQIYVGLEFSNKMFGLYRVTIDIFLNLFFFFSVFLFIDFIANRNKSKVKKNESSK